MVKIYLDGASLSELDFYANNSLVEGFTTNPSLMKRIGIKDYRAFAKSALDLVGKKPISFEVLSDEWDEMYRQANELQSLASNVYVKIPITNTKDEKSIELIKRLNDVNLNVTAVMTYDQIEDVWFILKSSDILSIFVGRINDVGHKIPYPRPEEEWVTKPQTLWASARQVYSVIDATNHGYDIITLTSDLIKKIHLIGKDLKTYSLETVKQFHEDGKGLTL